MLPGSHPNICRAEQQGQRSGSGVRAALEGQQGGQPLISAHGWEPRRVGPPAHVSGSEENTPPSGAVFITSPSIWTELIQLFPKGNVSFRVSFPKQCCLPGGGTAVPHLAVLNTQIFAVRAPTTSWLSLRSKVSDQRSQIKGHRP